VPLLWKGFVMAKFPVGGETMVRSSDPSTSHKAAREFRESGRLKGTQETVLNAVRKWPGCTMRELIEERLGEDLRTFDTRFSELKRKNYVTYGPKRPCRLTGKTCHTVYPVPMPRKASNAPR